MESAGMRSGSESPLGQPDPVAVGTAINAARFPRPPEALIEVPASTAASHNEQRWAGHHCKAS